MRINKYIASCGGNSRRSAEKLIEEKRVHINGKLVTNLGTDVDELNDTVTIDGKPLSQVNKKIYIMLHKPKGYITTVKDEKGRKTVMDFLPDFLKKVVKPIGRLDRDTEGLLLFTNDGDLANKLTSPSSQIKKHYFVTIEGEITKDEIKSISGGVEMENRKGEKVASGSAGIKVIEVKTTEDGKIYTRLEVIIAEGKNREVRKLFESINKTITLLKRTQIGSLTLGGLTRGKYKDFDPKFVLK